MLRSFRRAVRHVLELLLLVLAFYLLWAAAEVYLFAQRDQTRPAGAAIVLGAAVFGDRPSPVLRERLNHAIALYREGVVQTLIFTGGQGQPGEPPEAVVAKRYALAQGVPVQAILLESHSTTTVENLVNAQVVAQEAGVETFLIVSTPFHMRRAMAVAADLGMEAYSSPTRTTRWLSRYTRSRAFLREVVGFAAYQAGLLQ